MFSGAVVARARAIYEADTRDLEAGVKRAESVVKSSAHDMDRAMDNVSTTTHKAGLTFGTLAKSALQLGAVVEAFRLLEGAVGGSWRELEQQQKVAAQTNAVLKSTGSIAGVTAKEVEELGQALMRKSGVDDEVVKSGENMLLTFKNIRNVAGENNDIFSQSTKVLLDMETAMTHGNVTQEAMSQGAIRLGKALQDPVLGMTALKRVGVEFDEAQKDLIKHLVETGDVMGAQKVILHELNSEFGGSAEAVGKTLPGQLNILRETFKNVGADILSALIPALSKIVSVVVDAIPKIAAFGEEIGSKLSAAIKGSGASLDGALPAFRDFGEKALKAITGAFEKLAPEVGRLFGNVVTTLQAHQEDIQAIGRVLGKVFDGFVDASKDVIHVLGTVLPGVLGVAIPLVRKLFEALDSIMGAVGGWKTAFEVALGIFVGAKILTAIENVGRLTTAIVNLGRAQVTTAVEGDIAGIGNSAGVANTKVAGLLKTLALLKPLIAVTIAIEITKSQKFEDLLNWAAKGLHIPVDFDFTQKGDEAKADSVAGQLGTYFPGDLPGSGGGKYANALEGRDYTVKNGKVILTPTGKSRSQHDIGVFAGAGPGAGTTPSSTSERRDSTATPSGAIQVPKAIRSTHMTANLAPGDPGAGASGFPAVDIMAKPGTKVLAPENGAITRRGGDAPGVGDPNTNGYDIYFVGDSGNVYYITHLAKAAELGRYKKGDAIGTVAAGTQGGPHAHVGINTDVGTPSAATAASNLGSKPSSAGLAKPYAAVKAASGGADPPGGDGKGPPKPKPKPTSDAAEIASINAYLKKQGSPLAGQGAAILAASKKYNVPVELLLGIAGAETSFGTTGNAAGIHNAFGMGPGISYPTWKAGINAAAQNLRTNYLNKGLTTIEQIGGKWAPPGAGNDPNNLNSNWARNVRKYSAQAAAAVTTGGGPTYDPTKKFVRDNNGKLVPIADLADPKEKATEAASLTRDIEKIIPAIAKAEPDIRAAANKIGAAMKTLRAELLGKTGDGVITEDDLNRIEAQGKKLKHQLENLVDADAIRDKVDALGKVLKNIVAPEHIDEARKRIDSFDALFAKFKKSDGFISDAEIKQLELKSKQVNAAIARMGAVDEITKGLKDGRQAIKELFAQGFISPEDYAKDIAAIDKAQALIKKAWKDGKISPAEAKEIAAAYAVIPDEIAQAVEDKLQNSRLLKLRGAGSIHDTIYNALKDGFIITPDELEGITQSVSGLAGKFGEAIKKLVTDIGTALGKVTAAWDNVKSTILGLFDEVVVGKFQLLIDYGDTTVAANTAKRHVATVKKAFTDELAEPMTEWEQIVADNTTELIAAWENYWDALASGDKDRIDAAIVRLGKAQETFEGMELEGMSDRAKAIAAGGEALITAEEPIYRARIDAAKKHWEDMKKEDRQGLSDDLDALWSQYQRGEIDFATFNENLLGIAKKYGIDIGEATALLGRNIEGELGKAIGGLGKAIDALVGLLEKLATKLGIDLPNAAQTAAAGVNNVDLSPAIKQWETLNGKITSVEAALVAVNSGGTGPVGGVGGQSTGTGPPSVPDDPTASFGGNEGAPTLGAEYYNPVHPPTVAIPPNTHWRWVNGRWSIEPGSPLVNDPLDVGGPPAPVTPAGGAPASGGTQLGPEYYNPNRLPGPAPAGMHWQWTGSMWSLMPGPPPQPDDPGYATGGLIPGIDQGRDSVLAMLTPGEMVLNKAQQALLGGAKRLKKIFRFADGGIVGDNDPSERGLGARTAMLSAAREQMQKIWQVLRPHLPPGASMPPVGFPDVDPSNPGWAWCNVPITGSSGQHSGLRLPINVRDIAFPVGQAPPGQVSATNAFVGSPGYWYDNAIHAFVHEMAHAFQGQWVFGWNDREAASGSSFNPVEGGAEAFANTVYPQVMQYLGATGFTPVDGTPSVSSGTYRAWANQILSQYPNFAMRDQFLTSGVERVTSSPNALGPEYYNSSREPSTPPSDMHWQWVGDRWSLEAGADPRRAAQTENTARTVALEAARRHGYVLGPEYYNPLRPPNIAIPQGAYWKWIEDRWSLEPGASGGAESDRTLLGGGGISSSFAPDDVTPWTMVGAEEPPAGGGVTAGAFEATKPPESTPFTSEPTTTSSPIASVVADQTSPGTRPDWWASNMTEGYAAEVAAATAGWQYQGFNAPTETPWSGAAKGTVIVNQNFTTQPEDPNVYLQKSIFAAEANFG